MGDVPSSRRQGIFSNALLPKGVGVVRGIFRTASCCRAFPDSFSHLCGRWGSCTHAGSAGETGNVQNRKHHVDNPLPVRLLDASYVGFRRSCSANSTPLRRA